MPRQKPGWLDESELDEGVQKTTRRSWSFLSRFDGLLRSLFALFMIDLKQLLRVSPRHQRVALPVNDHSGRCGAAFGEAGGVIKPLFD